MAEQKLDIIGGFNKWINALMGKPVPQNTGVSDDNLQQGSQQDQEKAEHVQEQKMREDSVATDINALKSFVKKTSEASSKIIKPYKEKGSRSVAETTNAVKASVDNKFIKIIVRSFIIIFFAMILIFIAFYLFNRLKEEGGNDPQNGTVVESTPTPINFVPYKPSVYAEDPEILRLEEEIKILEGELYGMSIKETGINPPKLDWDIDFK